MIVRKLLLLKLLPAIFEASYLTTCRAVERPEFADANNIHQLYYLQAEYPCLPVDSLTLCAI